MHFTVVGRKGEIPMPECACGCGANQKGKFLQGHDQKLRKQLEEKVGGLPLLASLVKVTQMYAQDRKSLDGLGRLVSLIYKRVSRPRPWRPEGTPPFSRLGRFPQIRGSSPLFAATVTYE